MEFKITNEQAKIAAASSLVGAAIGAVTHHVYSVTHTPESKIQALNQAKYEYENTKRESEAKAEEARSAYRRLSERKREYQDEIRPNIEAKVREELHAYISKADHTYEKAKEERRAAEHDKEIASLKLELAKTLSQNTKERVTEKIIIKNKDDEEEL